ncbi:hypothetical protein C8F01DRAFT_1369590 [Mycena amicta]|nr:hypothetical protein C8F01DRAFT_1369590 [Mycena amicta]
MRRKREVEQPTASIWTPTTTPTTASKGSNAAPPVRPPVFANGMQMRSDRSAEPGKPDKPGPRCSLASAQVTQEKQKKKAEKETAAAKRKQGLRDAAAIERRVIDKDAAAGDHPPATNVQKKRRTRDAAPKPLQPVDYGVPDEPRDRASSGSDDDFIPPTTTPADDDLIDDSDVEAVKKSKKPPKKQKGHLRESINQMRDEMDTDPSGEVQVPKRRASEAGSIGHVESFTSLHLLTLPRSRKSSSKKIKTMTGMLPGWERGHTAFHGEDERGRSHSANSYTSHGASSRSQSAGSALSVPMSEADASGNELWGPMDSDEDETEEREYAAGNVEDVKTARRTTASIAGIVDTDTPELVPLATPANHRLKKKDIRINHLPPDKNVQGTFYVEFGSILVSRTAALARWSRLPDQAILHLFNETYPDWSVEAGNALGTRVVLKLSEDRVANLQTRLGSTAIELIEQLFAGKPINDVAADVEWLLTAISSDKYTQYHVFYFTSVDKVVDEGGDTKPKNPKNIFRHPLILGTLATFCKLTKNKQGVLGPRDDDKQLDGMHPGGALALAVQAVKRALMLYTSGSKSTTRPPTFSKDNHGDRPGAPVVRKIDEIIKLLPPSKWNAIIAGARAAAVDAKKTQVVAPLAPVEDGHSLGERVGLLGGDSDEEDA